MKPSVSKKFVQLRNFLLILTIIMSLLLPTIVSASELNLGINPVIVFESVKVEPAVAGGEFNVSMSVRNISKYPAFNVGIDFREVGYEGLEHFELKNPEAAKIAQLGANTTQSVLLTFAVKDIAQSKDHELVANLKAMSAETVGTGIYSSHSSINLTIPVTYDLTKPVIIVRDVKLQSAPDLVDGFTVDLVLENLSKTSDARNVVLLLDGKSNFEVLDISNKKNLANIGKGATETVSYRLRARDTRENNSVDLTLDYDYAGNQHESAKETVNLPLPTQDVAIGATPWVIINKYTLSADRVLAGNTVTLSLFIENTNQRAVKNVKISLGVIRIEETGGIGGGGTSGGTVFSPVNSSNSFYIDTIPGKTVITKTIDLYVDPNATAKTYIVPVTINYEDRLGKTLTSEEMVNIPVTQECKLQVLSVETPPVGFVGQPVSVMSEFVNVGKVSLGNFMVSLEGDFTTENGSYFIGNLDIGVSDFFQGMIIPREEGTLEGKLVFSYIDNNNKEVREENPFTIEIQAQPEMPPGMIDGEFMGPDGPFPGGMPGEGGGFFSKIKSAILPIILILVIVIMAVYIIRTKKKKAEEEFFND